MNTFLDRNAKQRKNIVIETLDTFIAILHRDIIVTLNDFISFLIQVLLQPLFFLFIFGKLLPSIGVAEQGFATLLFPGIIAFTIVSTSFQGVTLSLSLDLGYAREIEDRLLAPIPVALVAVEKIVFAALRGLLAGVLIFPLGYLILGDDFQVNAGAAGILVGIVVLSALAGASMGLTIGTLVKPEQLNLLFSLVFTILIFTGCMYYPWGALNHFEWFQIITLFNPLTYASEGMRYAMISSFHGRPFLTLGLPWILLGLSITFIGFLLLGVRIFCNRVIS